MKNKLRLHYFLVLFFLISNVSAQSGFSVHVGPSINLRNDNLNDVRAKEIGIQLGTQYRGRLSGDRWKYLVNVDYLFRNSTLVPRTEQGLYYGGYYYDYRAFTYPRNIPFSILPITLGISLNAPFYEESDFFLEGAIGPCYIFTPDMKFSYADLQYIIKKDVSRMMCLKLKAGFSVDETYFLTVNYFYYDGKDKSKQPFDFIDIASSTISLSFGYGF